MVRISLLRPTADEMDLQLLAALNNGRALPNIDELVWQTVFVSPDALALPALDASPSTVFSNSPILFSKSTHETCGSSAPHPASKSGKMTRHGIAGNFRMVPSRCNSRLPAHVPPLSSATQIIGECQDRTANPKKVSARLVNAMFPASDKVVVATRSAKRREGTGRVVISRHLRCRLLTLCPGSWLAKH
jgi:hypothetical protein